MNPEGYRVMGYAIPLNLFKTSDSGMKLYSDSNCTIEEKYNTTDISNPYYEMTVANIRRGEEKKIIRYIKNIGVSPTLYYVYLSDAHNMNYYFLDSNGNKCSYISGIQNPNMSRQINLIIEANFDDYTSDFKLHIVSRDLTSA